jgi:hypothetical protein
MKYSIIRWALLIGLTVTVPAIMCIGGCYSVP